MPNFQYKTTYKTKYSADQKIHKLLQCHHDIACINQVLKYHGSPSLTLEEISLILGIARERVRQIEASALKKLKHPKIARALREYTTE